MSIDIKKIPACIERSILQAFKIQVQTDVVIMLSMQKESLKSPSMDCLSTIILDSSTLAGSISLGLTTSTFRNISGKMLGEVYPEITSENCDISSELLNIIYAKARKEINELGHDFGLAIPSTVVGQNLLIANSNLSGQALFFNCTSELGDFIVMLSLKIKNSLPQ